MKPKVAFTSRLFYLLLALFLSFSVNSFAGFSVHKADATKETVSNERSEKNVSLITKVKHWLLSGQDLERGDKHTSQPNGLAVASLICGVGSLLCLVLCLVFIETPALTLASLLLMAVSGIAAIVLGFSARKKGQDLRLAAVGIIHGFISISLAALGLLIFSWVY